MFVSNPLNAQPETETTTETETPTEVTQDTETPEETEAPTEVTQDTETPTETEAPLSEESHKALLQTSTNMYIACSWFVQKAKAKGKDEKAIKEECLNFLAIMIQKLNEESK